MSDVVTIRADGAEIRGVPKNGEPGLYIAKDGMVGIDDGADIRREAIARSGERGEFDLAVFSGPKIVSLDLIPLADSITGLQQRRTEIKRIGQGGRRFLVEIDHLGQTLSGWARRGGRTTFRDSGRRHGKFYARAFVQWVFPDPILIGGTRSTVRGTSASVSHRGDAAIAPRIDVYGPFPNGYTITAAGLGTFTVTSALASGQMETVDIGSSRVYRNGIRRVGVVSVPGRWEIYGGELGVLHTIAGTGGTGTMVVHIDDAYD
ncbi:hypothetical protein [Microbacterium sp.]